jgi:hypothetical protein
MRPSLFCPFKPMLLRIPTRLKRARSRDATAVQRAGRPPPKLYTEEKSDLLVRMRFYPPFLLILWWRTAIKHATVYHFEAIRPGV